MAKRNHAVIALTGGIASGKSTAAAIFAKLGVPVVAADQLAREVVEQDPSALEEIKRLFGAKAISTNGTLDRAYLRQRIVADSTMRGGLEQITHPRIRRLAKARIAALVAQGHNVVIYDVPLLFEAGLEHDFDSVICVVADDALRIQRIMSRDGSTHTEAERILNIQLPQDEKVKRSDFVVVNNTNEADLADKCAQVLDKIKSSIKSKR